MKYKLLLLSVHLFIFCNCSNQKSSKPNITLKHQTINLGEDFVGYGGPLTFYQGTIVGVDLSPAMQPFFHIKPTASRQTLLRFGNKGQGPNEFLMPHSIQRMNNQTIGIFDISSKTFNEFQIPNEQEELKIDRKTEIKSSLYQVIKTSFNQYIGLSIKKDMFLLMDSTGTPVNTFFEYPYKDNSERELAFRAHAYQGTLTANPSKNKFVYSSFQGEIIHFYTIEKNNIKLINKIEKEYPLYRKRDDNYEGVIVDKNNTVGYISTYATDQFVYAIFSGIKTSELKSINFEGQILRIFDWDGTLVKEYGLDVPCSYLCVSDDDSKIWAVASNPNITTVLFDLRNIQSGNTRITQNTQERKSTHPTNPLGFKYIIEVEKDGVKNEETQKALELIMSQVKNGNRIDIDNSEIKQLDTLEDNTIRIVINLK